jgi:hypothetical protein
LLGFAAVRGSAWVVGRWVPSALRGQAKAAEDPFAGTWMDDIGLVEEGPPSSVFAIVSVVDGGCRFQDGALVPLVLPSQRIPGRSAPCEGWHRYTGAVGLVGGVAAGTHEPPRSPVALPWKLSTASLMVLARRSLSGSSGVRRLAHRVRSRYKKYETISSHTIISCDTRSEIIVPVPQDPSQLVQDLEIPIRQL